MSSKGQISTHALYTIGFIVITIILSFFAIQKGLDIIMNQTSAHACTEKLIKFCEQWKTNGYTSEPFDWDTTKPLECDEFEVYKPLGKATCEDFLTT